jgi:hypothetical protein
MSQFAGYGPRRGDRAHLIEGIRRKCGTNSPSDSTCLSRLATPVYAPGDASTQSIGETAMERRSNYYIFTAPITELREVSNQQVDTLYARSSVRVA